MVECQVKTHYFSQSGSKRHHGEKKTSVTPIPGVEGVESFYRSPTDTSSGGEKNSLQLMLNRRNLGVKLLEHPSEFIVHVLTFCLTRT